MLRLLLIKLVTTSDPVTHQNNKFKISVVIVREKPKVRIGSQEYLDGTTTYFNSETFTIDRTLEYEVKTGEEILQLEVIQQLRI